jgi:hypothetical protein
VAVSDEAVSRKIARSDMRGLRRIHHVGPQHVLAACDDRCALVQLQVRKDKGHAALGTDSGTAHLSLVAVIELCFATSKVVVEIHHEGQVAPLTRVTLEIPIKVRRKSLAGIVTVEAKPLVESKYPPVLEYRRYNGCNRCQSLAASG